MQQFRNLLSGWLGKVLLAIIVLVFALFGVSGIFTSNSTQDVAISVNGVEIAKIEVNNAIENQRRNLKQQMGGNIDDSFLTDELLRPRVVESLIQKELIRQASENDGMAVSANLVKSYVRSMPQFQDETGAFSNDKLESLLIQANYTKARLFDAVQESMVLEQLQSGISATAFITSAELDYIVKLNGQKRIVSYATLESAPLKAGIELSDADINEYFEANKAQYRTQEKVKVNYVVVGLDDFADDAEIDEPELTEAYDDYVNGVKSDERRRASHVLVEVTDDRSDEEAKARITEAKSKLDAGEAFDSVAKQYSDDTASANAGGDLDFAGRGLYDPVFEDALFGLKQEGDISPVIKSEFGYHIIKLTGVETPPIASYDEKKAELIAAVKQHHARVKLDEATDDISRKAFESGDLQLIAESYNKPIETTAFFNQQGGAGIAADPKFIAAAYSEGVIQDGHNSEVIELADGRVVVLRMAEHQPARDQELSEVDGQVRTALMQQKMRILADEKAEQIVSKLQEGVELSEVAKEFQLVWKENVELTRQSGDVSRSIVSTTFEMPKPSANAVSVKKVGLPNGDQEIIVLNKVVEGESTLSDTEALQAKAGAAQQFGTQDFNSYVASLRDKADIVIHD